MSDNLLKKINQTLKTLTNDEKQALRAKLQKQLGNAPAEITAINSDSLSHAQRRLWILEQFNHCDYLYHVPLIMTLPQPIDLGLLEEAFSQLITENPVLASRFIFEEDEVKQCSNKNCHVALQTLHLSMDLPPIVDISPSSPLADFYLQKFDLDKAPLFRLAVLKTPKQLYLLMCFHHLIIDGWSVNLIINRLSQIYNSLKHQLTSLPSSRTPSYSMFIEDEKNNRDAEKNQSYWLDRLLGKMLVVDIMTDFPRKSTLSGNGKSQHASISGKQLQQLQAYAKLLGVSMNQLVLFAFQFMLSRYSGQDQITVGIPTTGRTHPNWYQTIGLFVNTLLHTIKIDYNSTVKEQINQVKQQLINDMAHANQPFDEVVKALYEQKQLNPNGVFNILYNFIQFEQEKNQVSFDNSSCDLHYCTLPVSKFDLSLHVYATNSKLDLFLEFSTDLYEEKTVQHFVKYLLNILNAMPDEPDTPLKTWSWSLANQLTGSLS